MPQLGASLGIVMEQNALKNVNNDWNTSIFFYLETSGGQSSNLYLNVVYFFNASVNLHILLCQLKTVTFLRSCLIRAVLLMTIVYIQVQGTGISHDNHHMTIVKCF
jgi:hypothetical protein